MKARFCLLRQIKIEEIFYHRYTLNGLIVSFVSQVAYTLYFINA